MGVWWHALAFVTHERAKMSHKPGQNVTQAGPKCHTRAKMSHSHVVILIHVVIKVIYVCKRGPRRTFNQRWFLTITQISIIMDEIASWLSYLFNGNPNTWIDVFILTHQDSTNWTTDLLPCRGFPVLHINIFLWSRFTITYKSFPLLG